MELRDSPHGRKRLGLARQVRQQSGDLCRLLNRRSTLAHPPPSPAKRPQVVLVGALVGHEGQESSGGVLGKLDGRGSVQARRRALCERILRMEEASAEPESLDPLRRNA